MTTNVRYSSCGCLLELGVCHTPLPSNAFVLLRLLLCYN